LLDAAFDFAVFPRAFDYRGVVLVDDYLFCVAQVFDFHVLELDAQVLSDGLATSQDRDVFEHGLTAIAETRSLHRGALQSASQLVHYQGCQGFALNVLERINSGLPIWQSVQVKAAGLSSS